MFTTNHFIWLAICVVILAVMLTVTLKFKWNVKTVNLIMCGISIASELVKLFTHIKPVNGTDWTDGGYLRAVTLPLHLCSIFIFIFFYLALSKNEKRKRTLLNFFVPIGLFGATLALLMATSGVDFKTPDAYQSFIYHTFMLWYALYLVITKQFTVTLKGYALNVVLLFVLSIVMIWINGAFITCGADTVNFCFVVKPPADNLPFLNTNHGWFVYFIHLAITGVLLETAICLPFALKNEKRAKENKE